MNNIWHDLDDDRIHKDNFVACIEIPKGSKKKYESFSWQEEPFSMSK